MTCVFFLSSINCLIDGDAVRGVMKMKHEAHETENFGEGAG